MLRHSTYFLNLSIAVLLISGTVFSQSKEAEVSVTKCWEFPALDVVGLATNGREVFVALEQGRVIGLSATGDKLWETELGGHLGAISFDGKDIVAVTSVRSRDGLPINSVARHLAAGTGIPITGSNALDAKPLFPDDTTAGASSGDTVIVGNASGVVTSLSGNGPVWKFKTGGAISAVIAVDDKFVVISRDNFVYALRAKNGALEWKRRTQGRIGHYAVAKDVLFVSSLDQHGATLIDLDSGRVAAQILLNPEDQVLTDPVVLGDVFAVASGSGLASYSLGSCPSK
jgi:outer membrane protein assembly factor BamB